MKRNYNPEHEYARLLKKLKDQVEQYQLSQQFSAGVVFNNNSEEPEERQRQINYNLGLQRDRALSDFKGMLNELEKLEF